jgi:hypothetical protein
MLSSAALKEKPQETGRSGIFRLPSDNNRNPQELLTHVDDSIDPQNSRRQEVATRIPSYPCVIVETNILACCGLVVDESKNTRDFRSFGWLTTTVYLG